MNGRAPSDLVRQMWLLVAEEAFLWELTEQTTDYYNSEIKIAHGPWRASDCQQVISRWFDRELIDCIAYSWATKVRSDEVVRYEYDADWRARATEYGQHLVLARDDAGALLSDPTTWGTEGIGAGVMLCQSEQATGLSFDDWFGKLAGLPDRLIFEDPPDEAGEPQRTVTETREVLTSRSWLRAIQNAAADGLPMLCPVNGDAYLNIDWDTAMSETAAAESVEDIVCFIDPDTNARRHAFPFGRHRLSCPGCGAERYLVVTRRPD